MSNIFSLSPSPDSVILYFFYDYVYNHFLLYSFSLMVFVQFVYFYQSLQKNNHFFPHDSSGKEMIISVYLRIVLIQFSEFSGCHSGTLAEKSDKILSIGIVKLRRNLRNG